jgi:hypothetical protein
MDDTIPNPGRGVRILSHVVELMQINDNSSPNNMDIWESADNCFMTPLRLDVVLLRWVE